MRDLERWRPLFIVVATTLIMAVVGLFLAWVRSTERWFLFGLYCLAVGIIIWRFWDYRPPD